MDIQVMVNPITGEAAIVVINQKGVTYAQAEAKVNEIKRLLDEQGIAWTFTGDVEQHRHDADGLTVTGDISHLQPQAHRHTH